MVKTMTIAQLIERTESDTLFYLLQAGFALSAADMVRVFRVNELDNLSTRVQVCGKLVRWADTGGFAFRII